LFATYACAWFSIPMLAITANKCSAKSALTPGKREEVRFARAASRRFKNKNLIRF
jgi:hypothetical protein